VLQLKQQLFDHLLANDHASILSPQHLRVRDFKGGKLSGPLRDDRQLCKCLMGLTDGRKVVVQLLSHPEVIGADDVILSVRLLQSERQVLLATVDVPLPRKSTHTALATKLLETFPSLRTQCANTVNVAKAFSTGPPLTYKSALKLKWFEISLSDSEAEAAGAAYPVLVGSQSIDSAPLSVRDGTLLIIQIPLATTSFSTNNPQQHFDESSSKLVAALPVLQQQTTAVGGGAAAVRAKNVLARHAARLGPQDDLIVAGSCRTNLYNTSSNIHDSNNRRGYVMRERSLKITSTPLCTTAASTDDVGNNDPVALQGGLAVRDTLLPVVPLSPVNSDPNPKLLSNSPPGPPDQD